MNAFSLLNGLRTVKFGSRSYINETSTHSSGTSRKFFKEVKICCSLYFVMQRKWFGAHSEVAVLKNFAIFAGKQKTPVLASLINKVAGPSSLQLS